MKAGFLANNSDMYSPVTRIVLNQLAGLRWLRQFKDSVSAIPKQYDDEDYNLAVVHQHVAALRRHGWDPPAGQVIVEIGPGGNLGNALALVAAGAARVVCVDNYCHVGFHSRLTDFYRRLVDRILANPLGTLPGCGPSLQVDQVRAALDDAVKFSGDVVTFNEARIQYLAPCHASGIPLASNSVDMLFSHAVLEHVNRPEQACREFGRLIKPGGWTSHVIDLRDHFAPEGLQMLRYAESLWDLMSSNSHGHVNRRRAVHFETYFRTAGFKLVQSEATERLADLSAIPSKLDSDFAGLTAEQLAIVGMAIIGRRWT